MSLQPFDPNHPPTHAGDLSAAPSPLSRAGRDLARALQQQRGAAQLAAERIDQAALLAYRTMSHLDTMGMVESTITRADPLAAERVSSLIDDFVLIARSEIRSRAQGR